MKISTLFNSSILTCYLFGLALAMNILNFRSLDIFFGLMVIIGLFSLKKPHSMNLLDQFGLRWNLINALFIMFILSCAIGSILNDRPWADKMDAILAMRWIAGFYCCYYWGRRLRSEDETSLRPIPVLPFTIILAVVVYKYANNNLDHYFTIRNRLQGFYENPNHLGLTLVLSFAFLLALLLRPMKSWQRFFNVATLVLLSLAIFTTQSRTAWTGMLACIIVAAFYVKNKLVRVSTLGFFGICFLGFLLNLNGFKDRILYTLDFNSIGSQAQRLNAWKANFAIFLDHPLFGAGPDHTRYLFKSYYEKIGLPTDFILGNAHNQFLQVLAGAGLFGFISYMLIFTVGLVYFHRKYLSAPLPEQKSMALAGILVITGLMLSSFTDAPFNLHECRNYVLLFLGFSFGYLNKRAKTPPHDKIRDGAR